MIDSNKLPIFTFVDPRGQQQDIDLSTRVADIRGCADVWLRKATPGDVVGLCFPASSDQVFWWLGAILAGLRPLVMQYPTAKQSREYWHKSVEDTAAKTGLACVVCNEEVVRRFEAVQPGLAFAEPITPADDATPFLVEDYAILQLSSGTTGLRKAIAFDGRDLHRHAVDFNQVLGLGDDDVIVSWLPLYHDMGYVACFVMPMILGVRVAMMDPETWVADKALLYRTIESVGGTVCYMPNFGYEVMTQLPAPPMPTMRRWISCSEPVLGPTSQRFIDHVGCAPDQFSACYAMAENIFAMTMSKGLQSRDIRGRSVVSNGPAIPGVEIKLIEDEIWVRSPTSLRSYYEGEDITDADGFYPTGDLGELQDGEIYIFGRKRDLLIQAGKKFMLSAIDAAVNEAFPEVKGRVAAVVDVDDRLGTAKPIVLIEAQDFFRRRDHQDVRDEILRTTGLEYVEVAFVPPRFLTKTSSGKINRPQSLAQYKAAQEGTTRNAAAPAEAFAREFSGPDPSVPVGQLLDSLSLTVLRIILNDAGLSYDAGLTLADYAGLLQEQGATGDTGAEVEVFRIVSLADRRLMALLDAAHLAPLEAMLGCPVQIEHVCLPPTPVILSDLIFLDYFAPALPDTSALGAVMRQLETLRAADLILIDDAAELHFSLSQSYPVLSHRLERTPEADLLSYRWQAYAYNHSDLPIAVVDGSDLDLADRQRGIEALSDYLDTPIFRIATVESLEEFTQGWDYQDRVSLSGGPGLRRMRPKPFVRALTKWLSKPPRPLGRSRVPEAKGGTRMVMEDLAHFCCWSIDKDAVDRLIGHFDRYCIAGGQHCLRYLTDQLTVKGKSFSFVPSPTADLLATAPAFDCLIVCGPTIDAETDLPVAGIMAGAGGPRMSNTDDPDLSALWFRGELGSCSPDHWYSNHMTYGQSRDVSHVREAREIAVKLRDERLANKRRAGNGALKNGADPDLMSEGLKMSDEQKNETPEERAARVKEARIEERRAARRAERQAARVAEGKSSDG